MRWAIHGLLMQALTQETNSGVLWREIPMAWGTTIDSLTPEINPFLYARETKYLTVRIINPPLSKFGHMSKLGVMSKSGVHPVYL